MLDCSTIDAHGAGAGLGVEGAGRLGGAVHGLDELGVRAGRGTPGPRARPRRPARRIRTRRAASRRRGGWWPTTPCRLPSTARMEICVFSSATFWLMRLLAKRVSAEDSEETSTSAASAGGHLHDLAGECPDLLDGHRHQRPTPTWTSRNLAGEAPCATWATCIGSPLPQLASPHTPQYSREHTASHEFQNFGEMPV